MSSFLRSLLLLSCILSLAPQVHADLAAWQTQVNTGATPSVTRFTSVSGSSPVNIHVGTLTGARSFEFVYNAAGAAVSKSILGSRDAASGAQVLKVNQWNNTGKYGLSALGVADDTFNFNTIPNQQVHLVFTSNGSTTTLYVNGVDRGTIPRALNITGSNALGAFWDTDITNFNDNLDGTIFGFASYGSALSPSEISTHNRALLATPPTVTGISPNSGSALGGVGVTITGADFNEIIGVTIGGAAATIASIPSSSSIVCITPAGTPGARSVQVTTIGGTNAANLLFTYVASAPTVTAISPATGTTAGGTSVTLTGTNFTGATAVTIGGAAATSVNVVSSTSITCITPAGTAGARSVLVTTPGGTNAANTLYTYVSPPTVTTISPATGTTAGGTSVTLTGTNFTGATAVTIGGAAATSVNVVSATSITCVTPAGTAGARSVLVTTPGGTNAANTLYTYVSPPTVTTISPATGTTAGGTSVTLTGTNFTGATAVTIGGAAATSVNVVSATSITCVTPAGTAGARSVLVTTPGGTNAANTLYTYVIPPTVTTISPATGTTAGGTSVTLTGTNFTGATTVTIGAAAATSVNVVSSTSITCVTPAGTAGARSVLVTTPGGTNAANTLYTYTAPGTAPVATAQSVTLDEDKGKLITLSGTDADPGTFLSYTIVTQPTNGSLTGTGPTQVYVPFTHFNGTDSFTFRVHDGGLSSATANVSLTINPVAEPALSGPAFPEFIDPNPSASNGFGTIIVALNTGNVVITSPQADIGGVTDCGAVYLFNGATGALISTLRGSTANDQVGLSGVRALPNGNFIVCSAVWDNGATADAGAATWGHGTTGVSGVVSVANSLVGSTASDGIGSGGMVALTHGNYVVISPNWDNGAVANAGAVTWGNGSTGISGAVSAANSLVGTTANDQMGSGNTTLAAGVTALMNGNYVVISPTWDNGAVINAGAATWGNGTTGISGAVSASNSLVGITASDQVGTYGATALINGNYVVNSRSWGNGAASSAGAVTWGNGSTGISGAVSTANSLTGTNGGANVGLGGVTALSNGHYVVASHAWSGTISQQGAVTWGNGTTGISGFVSAANSLVGPAANDQVGGGGVTALANGNYVVTTTSWDNGAVTGVGAVTWVNGSSATTGTVTAANSLIGSTSNDGVGSSGVIALTNGNYVARSSSWDNGAAFNAGAVTWGNGSTGTTGVVSAANSLVGSTTSDELGAWGVTALLNGNYVVSCVGWDNGATINAGSVTWGNGTTGVTGTISTANSLVSTSSSGNLGQNGLPALANGNYVVGSANWNAQGAATWGNGSTGTIGLVSATNSLVGTGGFDNISITGLTALPNGNYVVTSADWNNGATTDAGAVTWANGTTGLSGTVSAANSQISGVATAQPKVPTVEPINNTFITRWTTEGKVRLGSLENGFLFPPTVTAISPTNGTTLGGTSVTITGTNFTGATAVAFGGAAATSVNVVSATSITCVTPAGTAGTASVVVVTPGGANAANTLFTYVTPPPTVSAISPSAGTTLGGTSVTITGTNFTGATAVTIGGAAVTGMTVVNSTTITCVTPAGTAGARSVLITTPGGTTAANSLYTYVSPPTVTAISPNNGSTLGGTSVTITGTNFTGTTGVSIGGVAATSFTFLNATSITAITPARSAGSASVVVTTLGGPNAANSLFTYVAPPAITGISPNSGTTLGGTGVTITGTGFTGATSVTIGGVAATIGSVTSTAITATTPARPAGAANVVVTNTYGSGTGTNLYTYIVPTPGDLDPLNANIVGITVLASAVQPDGKMIVGGTFSQAFGAARQNIARLNADGTLDATFDPKTNGSVTSVAVQSDGKVLLGGNFTTLQPNGAGAATTRNRVARVNADGTLDTTFNPNANSTVNSIAVQVDGKVLLGGVFNTLQPNGAATATTRNRIARVNADGTLDTTFDPNANDEVRAIALQADGKVLLGGVFTTLQPAGAGAATTLNRVARLNADGTLDATFNPNANNTVNCVAVQADGKVLLGGLFTSVSATTRNRVARVNADGTLDTTFDPNANSTIASIVQQADGKVLLGGVFTTLQPNGAASATTRQYAARLNTDGTADSTFNPNADNDVYSLALQADGMVLLGGYFSALQPNGAPAPTLRNFFARLANDSATQSLTTPDTASVLWTRGGAGPELSGVSFENSTNGGSTWTPLSGTAVRVGSSASWTLTGTALPASGHIRARGRTAGGYFSGSTGLIEQITAYTAPIAVPTVTSIAPATGTTSGGTSVTITGTGFSGVTSVTIGGVAATSFTLNSPSSISAVTPSGPAGTASVLVTTPGGTNAANTLYTYANTAPTLSDISDRSTDEDTSTASIAIGVSDSETDVASLVLTASSSNVTLVPNANLVLGGSGASRTLIISPAANLSGTSTITLTVTDGLGLTATDTFVLTVNPVNDLPSFTKGANQNHLFGTTAGQSVGGWATAIDDGDAAVTQALTFNVSVTSGSIFTTAPSISSTGTLTYTPNGTVGTASISLTLTDDATAGGAALTTVAQTFTITVNPIAPGAPTIGLATRGDASAGVAFTAPASNGGSAITGYTVTSSPGNFTGTGSVSPITVNGLTNGTAYTFTVTATNAVGTGAASAASNSVTPATVPGAPIIGLATRGNASASVAFTAPASNGGSAVTGYTVTSSPSGITGSGAVSPITVSGLTNGTAYTFSVTATNVIGTGAASAASNSVTPLPPPTVTNISPASGTTLGGTGVTITGSNFTGATSVTIGGATATIGTISSTTLTATTPAGTAGTASVVITTPSGSNAANTAFTYFAPTTTTLVSSQASSNFLTPPTFTAQATAAQPGITGQMELFIDNVLLEAKAVDTTGTAAFTPPASALTVGSRTIKAVFNGSQAVASFASSNATITQAVTKSTLTPTLGGLSQVYDGTGRAATATVTIPPTHTSVQIDLTYNGSATLPTNAGSYAVVATINDPSLQGTASGTLVITQAPSLLTFSSLSVGYNGQPRPVSVLVDPVVPITVTYQTVVNGSLTGAPVSTAPTNIGVYRVVASTSNSNYSLTTSSADLTITKGTVAITLGSLSVVGDGTPKPVTVTTSPPGLPVSVGYALSHAPGTPYSSTPPSAAPAGGGFWKVLATVDTPNYIGSAKADLEIRPGKIVPVITLQGTTNLTPPSRGLYTVKVPPFAKGVRPSGMVTAKVNGNILGSFPLNEDGTRSFDIALNFRSTPYSFTAEYSGDTNYLSAASNVVLTTVNSKQILELTSSTSLTFTYDGAPKSVSFTTKESVIADIPINVTYNGVPTPPTDAGTYYVNAIIDPANPTYRGSLDVTLVINKAQATITLRDLSHFYEEGQIAYLPEVSTQPAGLETFVTYDGTTAWPSGIGEYQVNARLAGHGKSSNYTATPVTDTLKVMSTLVQGGITGGLIHDYDGNPKGVSITTIPVVKYLLGYNHETQPTYRQGKPVAAGHYGVLMRVDQPPYIGEVTSTMTIRGIVSAKSRDKDGRTDVGTFKVGETAYAEAGTHSALPKFPAAVQPGNTWLEFIPKTTAVDLRWRFEKWEDGHTQSRRDIRVGFPTGANAHNYAAIAVLQQYLKATASGTGKVKGEGWFDVGKEARFDAVPGAGHVLDYWSYNGKNYYGERISTDFASLTLIVEPASDWPVAYFVPGYTAQVIAWEEQGTASFVLADLPNGKPVSRAPVPNGRDFIATAVPKDGWLFDYWGVGPGAQNVTNPDAPHIGRRTNPAVFRATGSGSAEVFPHFIKDGPVLSIDFYHLRRPERPYYTIEAVSTLRIKNHGIPIENLRVTKVEITGYRLDYRDGVNMDHYYPDPRNDYEIAKNAASTIPASYKQDLRDHVPKTITELIRDKGKGMGDYARDEEGEDIFWGWLWPFPKLPPIKYDPEGVGARFTFTCTVDGKAGVFEFDCWSDFFLE